MNWNVSVGATFTFDQLDNDVIVEHTDREYKPGYSSWRNTYNGLICEHILTDLCSYTDDARPYKDLFNPEVISVEVKSFNKHRDAEKYKKEVIATLWERKVMWKKDISNYVIFFERDDDEGVYTVDELFEWNDKEQRYISVQSRTAVV